MNDNPPPEPPPDRAPEMKDETPAPWEDMDALTAGGGRADDSEETDN